MREYFNSYLGPWLIDGFDEEMFRRPHFILTVTHETEEFAKPVFKYLVPLVVIPATLFDSIIVVILLKKHLRTPTNIVLIGMAIDDMLTGIFASIWTTYYYTFDGHITDKKFGITLFWNKVYLWCFKLLPNIFHTSSVLLTVYLIIQRYFYICRPTSVDRYCTNRTSICMIIFFNLFSALTVLPEMLKFELVPIVNFASNNHLKCLVFHSKWFDKANKFMKIGLWIEWLRAFMHFIPCCLLLYFTYRLSSAMKESDRRKQSCTSGARNLTVDGSSRSFSYSKTVTATNRILFSICGWVLFIELAGCIAYITIFVNKILSIKFGMTLLGYLHVIRCILILMASPFQFSVYVSMSEQFRLTSRQVFSGKTIYTTHVQKTLNGGKKYSLIMVDPVPDVVYEPLISVILRRIFERRPPTPPVTGSTTVGGTPRADGENEKSNETAIEKLEAKVTEDQLTNSTRRKATSMEEVNRLAKIVVDDTLAALVPEKRLKVSSLRSQSDSSGASTSKTNKTVVFNTMSDTDERRYKPKEVLIAKRTIFNKEENLELIGQSSHIAIEN